MTRHPAITYSIKKIIYLFLTQLESTPESYTTSTSVVDNSEVLQGKSEQVTTMEIVPTSSPIPETITGFTVLNQTNTTTGFAVEALHDSVTTMEPFIQVEQLKESSTSSVAVENVLIEEDQTQQIESRNDNESLMSNTVTTLTQDSTLESQNFESFVSTVSSF